MISYISYILKYNELENRYNTIIKGFVANRICKFLHSIDKNGNRIYQNKDKFLEESKKYIGKYYFIYNVFSKDKLELESVNFVGEYFKEKYFSLLKEAMEDPEYYYFMNIYRYFDDFEVKYNRYSRNNLLKI